MDPFVEEKLSELGLERFIPVFEENEIDRETFLLLDDETMKELIKPVGPRLKLKKELQSLVKDEQAWFAPAIGGHDSSGFLENRLRNVRRRDSHKASKPPTVMVPKSPLVSTVDLDLPEDELADSDIAAMTTWLKFHTSPTQQVEEMMRKTCRARATLIRTENEKTVAEIIKEYPRLIDVPGMIEQDFRILFPTSSDSLFMKWPVTYESILTYADKQISWREILNFSGKLDTDEQKSNMTVHLLPLLFPPGMKRKDGKKGPKHASTEDACTSFIQVEKVGVNIPAFLEAVKKCQPFILAVGQLESPEQVFVVVERQTVDCGSLLKGLDICFKLFYILDMTYPWECINLWDFVQKFIYGLGAGKGRHKSVPSVSLLINFLTSAATEPSKE